MASARLKSAFPPEIRLENSVAKSQGNSISPSFTRLGMHATQRYTLIHGYACNSLSSTLLGVYVTRLDLVSLSLA